jgi:hypothetical protein
MDKNAKQNVEHLCGLRVYLMGEAGPQTAMKN